MDDIKEHDGLECPECGAQFKPGSILKDRAVVKEGKQIHDNQPGIFKEILTIFGPSLFQFCILILFCVCAQSYKTNNPEFNQMKDILIIIIVVLWTAIIVLNFFRKELK